MATWVPMMSSFMCVTRPFGRFIEVLKSELAPSIVYDARLDDVRGATKRRRACLTFAFARRWNYLISSLSFGCTLVLFDGSPPARPGVAVENG